MSLFCWKFCQAQPQLNSTQSQVNLRLRWSLFPFDPATHPPTHPPAGKVSFSLNSISTPAQPQLNLISTQLNVNSNYWAWHYLTPACFLILIFDLLIDWFLKNIDTPPFQIKFRFLNLRTYCFLLFFSVLWRIMLEILTIHNVKVKTMAEKDISGLLTCS